MPKPPPLTIARFRRILAEVEYKNWDLVYARMGAGFYVQWSFYAPDSTLIGEAAYAVSGPPPRLQMGRKWYVSRHSTRSEVVLTCLKAALACEEHEARERFRFRGHAIFGPHLHVDQLVTLIAAGAIPTDGRT